MNYPYPDNNGQTHYEECYRERGHHNCAVREIERLNFEHEEEIKQLTHEANAIEADITAYIETNSALLNEIVILRDELREGLRNARL